jgi:hypothetical protein
MPQVEPKSPSRRKTQKIRNLKSVATDVNNVVLDDDSCTSLIHSPKLIGGSPPNNFGACIVDQVKELLECPSNDTPDYQNDLHDDDPFSWEVERVVQHFESLISLPMFEEALRSHEITGWLLLWEVNSEVLKKELLVNDLAQQKIIWDSILELRQKSKGYHQWTAEWGFVTSLDIL